MRITILFALVFCIVISSDRAESSWLIDPFKYHVSVHGQLSCDDCHSKYSSKTSHPDIRDINKNIKDFFNPDQCAHCHEEILDNIDAGIHGGKNVTPDKENRFCLKCHDPHYQLTSSLENEIEGKPLLSSCDTCHDPRDKLPESPPQDISCMECHRLIMTEIEGQNNKIAAMCLHCHSDSSIYAPPPPYYEGYPLINTNKYAGTTHHNISCLSCHPRSAEFGHSDQSSGDCRDCHIPHHEKVAHDAHSRVSCEACHLKYVIPIIDNDTGLIIWKKDLSGNSNNEIHEMLTEKNKDFCRRCHHEGNNLGASSAILPAKSVICIPCHAGTFSFGDSITIISVLIFILGCIGLISIFISGNDGPRPQDKYLTKSSIGKVSIKLFYGIRAVLFDVLFQRRLFKISRVRWLIHGLVFYPFIIRFCWGIFVLISSLWFKRSPVVSIMVDKNQPLAALFFDITGLIMLSGLICLMIQRKKLTNKSYIKGLVKSDWLAFFLLMGIITAGFILEGMRIAMTGSPPGVEYAFLGNALSRFFINVDLTGLYGYMWYIHAVLTGLFVAYLPFSRMIHMIITPVNMIITTDSRK